VSTKIWCFIRASRFASVLDNAFVLSITCNARVKSCLGSIVWEIYACSWRTKNWAEKSVWSTFTCQELLFFSKYGSCTHCHTATCRMSSAIGPNDCCKDCIMEIYLVCHKICSSCLRMTRSGVRMRQIWCKIRTLTRCSSCRWTAPNSSSTSLVKISRG